MTLPTGKMLLLVGVPILLLLGACIALVLTDHRWWALGVGCTLFAGLTTLTTLIWIKRRRVARNNAEQLSGEELRRISALLDFIRKNPIPADMRTDGPSVRPWFLLLGPSQSGKTSLLQRADIGISFATGDTYRADIEQRGAGGTKGADYFVGDRVVALDVTGEYVDDSKSWLTWLCHLRHRRIPPLNGVLACVPAQLVVNRSNEPVKQVGGQIRRRLDEIHRVLGVEPPVYVVVTQCDRIAGFQEFLADLSRSDQRGSWGGTVASGPTTPREAFQSTFDAVATSLGEVLTARLAEMHPTSGRDRAVFFPSSFAHMRGNLAQFVDQLVRPIDQQTPVMPAFYFTSATQGGAQVDPLGVNAARILGLELDSTTTNASERGEFFLTGMWLALARHAHIPGLSRAEVLARRRKSLMAMAISAGSLAVLSLNLCLWSFTARQQMSAAPGLVRQAKTMRAPVTPEMLRALNSLRATVDFLDSKWKVPLSFLANWGFSSRAPLRQAYINAVERIADPPSLCATAEIDPERVPLKAALETVRGERSTRERRRDWAQRRLDRTSRSSEKAVGQLARHFAYAVSHHRAAWTNCEAGTTLKADDVLNRYWANMYPSLKMHIGADARAISVTTLGVDHLVSSKQVEACFTKAASDHLDEFFQYLESVHVDRPNLREALLSRYVSDYQMAWESFLTATSVGGANVSRNKAKERLQAFATSGDSPIIKMVSQAKGNVYDNPAVFLKLTDTEQGAFTQFVDFEKGIYWRTLENLAGKDSLLATDVDALKAQKNKYSIGRSLLEIPPLLADVLPKKRSGGGGSGGDSGNGSGSGNVDLDLKTEVLAKIRCLDATLHITIRQTPIEGDLMTGVCVKLSTNTSYRVTIEGPGHSTLRKNLRVPKGPDGHVVVTITQDHDPEIQPLRSAIPCSDGVPIP